MPNKRGFTLIELMLVIAIITILALIALPQLGNAIAHAKWCKMYSDMDRIRLAGMQYNADQGNWATQTNDGVLPTGFSSYLAEWPSPPCKGYTYQWQNWTLWDGSVMIGVSLCNPTAGSNPFNLYIQGGTGSGAGPDIVTAPHLLRCTE
jgi:prepilin-type N-terminal cleavage/methylation domain-containing protein